MNKYLIIGVVAVVVIAGGWWYLNQPNTTTVSETGEQTTQDSMVVEQSGQQNAGASVQTNPTPAQQTASSISNGSVKITSPNGGETFKLGDTVRITWNVQNAPAGSQLHLELFEITGDRPVISAQGVCTNCTESGLRSGVPYVSVTNGAGSAEWVAGKQYNGSTVNPGSRYIMNATVSKAGYANAGECPLGSVKGTCEVFYQIDWSDGVFSLTN